MKKRDTQSIKTRPEDRRLLSWVFVGNIAYCVAHTMSTPPIVEYGLLLALITIGVLRYATGHGGAATLRPEVQFHGQIQAATLAIIIFAAIQYARGDSSYTCMIVAFVSLIGTFVVRSVVDSVSGLLAYRKLRKGAKKRHFKKRP